MVKFVIWLSMAGCLLSSFAHAEVIQIQRKETPGMYAIIDTSLGKIVCQLFDKEAPKTVANFTGLAEGTKEFIDTKTGQKAKRPFYDGLIFHRVIPNFMIQTGCPLGKGYGGPGYQFEDEIAPSLKFDRPGRLAMANAGPNTNGSQFFITEVATPWLDRHHTIFGQVVEGQDIVTKIARAQRNAQDKPLEDIVIKKITIERSVETGNKDTAMKNAPLAGKKVLFVVAPKDFRDEEYFEPKAILTANGAAVVTASLSAGELTGMMGGKAKSDILLNNAKASDYAAVVFIGGAGAEIYFNDPVAHQLTKDAASQGKIVGAICIAPVTLAKAGLLKGKATTCFSSEEKELTSAGASFTGKPVERDGNIITASGPEAAKEFGTALVNALK